MNERAAAAAPADGRARWALIAQSLRDRIVAGEWRAGDAIPAESALARSHGVALGTMRAAIESLSDEGLLERIQGRGTFVRAGIAGAGLSRFFRWGDGGDALPQSRVLSVRTVAASAEVARALGAQAKAPVLRLRRHRVRERRVLLVETIWLPLPAFAALETLAPADFGPLLYPLVARRCGIVVHRAVDDIAFHALDARTAATLGLDPGDPGVRIVRRAYDLAGRAVEYRITRGDAREFRYRAEVR